jgi:hypothetical protein
MPCRLNASQIRHPFGVPLARLPSSSSTARNTVYPLLAAHPSTDACGLHWPPDATRQALWAGVRLQYQRVSIRAQPAV